MVQGGTCDSFELMFEMILYAMAWNSACVKLVFSEHIRWYVNVNSDWKMIRYMLKLCAIRRSNSLMCLQRIDLFSILKGFI